MNSITNCWKQKLTTSKWYKLSSLAHATVQGKLEQMIRERRQDLEGLKLIVMMATEKSRDSNGVGSGRIASILILPRLFKLIHILVPFKKLNRAGQVW